MDARWRQEVCRATGRVEIKTDSDCASDTQIRAEVARRARQNYPRVRSFLAMRSHGHRELEHHG